MESYNSLIKQKIDESSYGSAFVVSDFTGISDYATAKKSLARLCDRGLIRRVIRGVYDKPQYSELIKEYAAPDPNEVAMAIARNFNWTIVPSGNAALNFMGLSTQVPTTWEFSSSGPYRDYRIGNIVIEFKHAASKDIAGMSPQTALLIQAIKAIGKDKVDLKVKGILDDRINNTDRELILQEAQHTTAWVFSKIKDICSMRDDSDVRYSEIGSS